MKEPPKPYVFTRGERPLFSEIYFPKKIAYQGTIFRALEKGLKGNVVRNYLKDHIVNLLDELKEFPGILDPYLFDDTPWQTSGPITPEEAKRRIKMYHSNFYGWSMYEVNGVFLGRENRIDEELTQVVRVMFRFESKFSAQAEQIGCGDALRTIHFWFMNFRGSGSLWEQKPWGPAEKEKLLRYHEPWPENKRKFVEEHFEAVTKEAVKWIGDCALFTYGYLVREFWKTVLKRERKEDEIWVTSIWNLLLNVIKQIKPPTPE